MAWHTYCSMFSLSIFILFLLHPASPFLHPSINQNERHQNLSSSPYAKRLQARPGVSLAVKPHLHDPAAACLRLALASVVFGRR